jgi:hypothetical protein
MTLTMGLLAALSGATTASASSKEHFGGPGAIAVCAGRVWVTNSNNSVTEINETTGVVVRVLDAYSFNFTDPEALGCSGNDLWVVDKGTATMPGKGDGVTEINASSGHLVRFISSPAYEFDAPDAIAVGRSHVWIASGATPLQPPTQEGATGNSVTELNATNGSLVRVIGGSKDKLNYLTSVAILGSHVWVGGLNNLTELNSSNGSLVRVIKNAPPTAPTGVGAISSSPTALTVTGPNLWEATLSSVTEVSGTTGASLRTVGPAANPSKEIDAIASSNSDVWVANYSNSVFEINATTGKHVMAINTTADKLDETQGIALSAKDVWVTSAIYNAVIELNITTGALVRVIK